MITTPQMGPGIFLLFKRPIRPEIVIPIPPPSGVTSYEKPFRFPEGDKYLKYGIPYKHRSFIDFELRSDTRYSLRLVENEQFKSSFNSTLIVYSDTTSYKTIYSKAFVNPNIRIISNHQSRFTEIEFKFANSEISILSDHATSFLSPTFKYIDIRAEYKIDSESTFNFDKAAAPVTIVNNVNRYSKDAMLMLLSNTESKVNALESNSYDTKSDLMISIESNYLATVEISGLNITQFSNDETLALYSESEFSINTVQQKINAMDSIIDINLNVDSNSRFKSSKKVGEVKKEGNFDYSNDDEVILLSLIATLIEGS